MMFHLDEARTLRAFWKLLKGFNVRHDQIIGHNLFDFVRREVACVIVLLDSS
ncbi:MAG TPA: hypothetical protein VKA97_00940 [Pyrinomonadaceae bacterium]|nr:hypothetical protein [Pyrinomonadaceae bacterium]